MFIEEINLVSENVASGSRENHAKGVELTHTNSFISGSPDSNPD
jgi:hypothetical protein